jgi:hypothetical protein
MMLWPDAAAIARYPDASEAYEDAWLLALTTGRSEKAVEILQRGRRVLPSVGSFANGLGYAYLSLGRPDEALRHFEAYVRLRPNEPNALDSLAEALFAAGDMPEALDTAKRALSAGHDSTREDIGLILAASGRYDQAMTMLTDGATRAFALARLGRCRNADTAIETARAEAMSNGAWEWAALLDLLRALVALERNDCARARRQAGLAEVTSAKEGVDSQSRHRVRTPARRRLRRSRGKLADARGHRDRQRSVANLSSLPERWWVHALEGEIALASGDPAAAVAACQSGSHRSRCTTSAGVKPGSLRCSRRASSCETASLAHRSRTANSTTRSRRIGACSSSIAARSGQPFSSRATCWRWGACWTKRGGAMKPKRSTFASSATGSTPIPVNPNWSRRSNERADADRRQLNMY